MAQILGKAGEALVLVGSQTGHTVIPTPTPLTRLNFFDGKFLRADDLRLEQQYLRGLVALSNQAGGSGVVHGFDTTLEAGDALALGPGMAVDGRGRVLLLPHGVSVSIATLLEASRRRTPPQSLRQLATAEFGDCEVVAETPPSESRPGGELYLITIGHAEAYCGEEDVYGRLCEEACVTSKDRPYRVEGLVIRALPLLLLTPLTTTRAIALDRRHLRSLVASAYFADEAARVGHLISRDGLARDTWCLGADAQANGDVPLAVLARAGDTTVFLDAWIARREHIEPPPRRYWAWRMRMRPWDVYLAQILQFQCQLRDALERVPEPGRQDDPCADRDELMRSAVAYLSELEGQEEQPPALHQLVALKGSFQRVLEHAALSDRILIRRGIIELPPAAYLPVMPGATVTVNTQVRRLLGEGVDLRFCVVRADFVPHALEEVQHMERISLLQGLDDPNAMPRVDVLVPDGEIVPAQVVPAGTGYEMSLELKPAAFRLLTQLLQSGGDVAGQPSASLALTNQPLNEFASVGQPPSGFALLDGLRQPGPSMTFRGAGRGERSDRGGYVFHFAGALAPARTSGAPAFTLIELLKQAAVWTSLEIERDPFELDRHEQARVLGDLALAFAGSAFRLRLNGDLQFIESVTTGPRVRATTQVTGSVIVQGSGPAAQNLPPRVINISDRVVLARERSAVSGTDFEMILPQPSLLGALQQLLSFRTTRRWTTPLLAEVDGTLQLRMPGQPAAPSFTLIELGDLTIPLYKASQTINPDVLGPNHPAHEASLTAVRIIASAIGEPRFEDLAVRRLFPPPRPLPRELVIRAHEDWVLVHRRRDKQCAPVRALAPGVQPRRYRLYHVALADAAARDALHQALVTNNGAAINAFEPQAVDVIEFSAGIPALESTPEHVAKIWASRVPASAQVTYGAIASQGTASDEGTTLAEARLATLTDVLAPGAPSEAIRLESLPMVPDASVITATPHDGVIILATLAVSTVCHQVYRWGATQPVADLIQAIQGSDASVVEQALVELGAQHLGQAKFVEGTDQLVLEESADLPGAWIQHGDGTVRLVLVISQRPASLDDVTEEEEARIDGYLAQAAQIASHLNLAVPAAGFLHEPPEDTEPLEPCPAISVLVASAQ